VDVSLTLRVLPRKPVSPICDCYSVFELMFSLYLFMLPLHNKWYQSFGLKRDHIRGDWEPQRMLSIW